MKIIAELCQNHNGDMKILKEMVKKAAENGADICKIQTIRAKDLIYWKHNEEFRPYPQEYKRLQEFELTVEDEKKFVEYCKEFGVESMTTLFTLNHGKTVEDFNEIGYRNLKISGYSIPYLKFSLTKLFRGKYKLKFDHLYFSTSSLTYEEIKDAIKIFQKQDISFTMMNCTCIYPTPLEKLNLQNIPFYKEHFKLDIIGLSDHSNPHEDNLLSSKLAIFQGIDALERHFTILDKDDTRDGKVSITPDMLKEIKRFSELSKEEQYKEINEFNETQKFNHSYYRERF